MTDEEIESCCVGDTGVAESALAPSGEVQVNGRVFSARASGPSIDISLPIVVVGSDVGGLVVQRWDGSHAQALPERGKVIYATFGERAKAIAKQEQADRIAEIAAWENRARGHRKKLGFVFGIVASLVLGAQGDFDMLLANMAWFCGGFVWANLVFRILDSIIRNVDDGLYRLVMPATLLALVGSAFGLGTAGSFGVPIALAMGVCGAVVGGFLMTVVGLVMAN